MLARLLAACLAVGLALAGVEQAAAQAWPDRPVKILVPYAAGGNTDVIARLIGQSLGDQLGQQFVIDNRPGASGALAAEGVARAAPDGYTIFLASLPQLAILPAMTKVKYDPIADFAPIANIGSNAFVLVAHPGLAIKTPADFIAHAKAQAGKMSYASGGIGSHMNLTMQLFLKQNSLEVTPVHYRGGTEPLNAVLAGHVPVAFLNASDVVQPAATGTLRAIGVSSTARLPAMPGVPTIAEQGFKDFSSITWNGLAAPTGTPQPIIDKVAAGVATALKDPKVLERLAAVSVTPIGNGPKEFAADVKTAVQVWGDVVRAAGLQEK